jgi:hypothetical protein
VVAGDEHLHNAGIRSGIDMTGAPIRLITRPFRRGG